MMGRIASKIVQDEVRVLVWWKDGIEHFFDSSAFGYESQSLDESLGLKLEGR
jgi:hypothetical protein